MKKLYIIPGWTYNLDKWQAIQPFLRAADIEPVILSVPGLIEPTDKAWDIDGYIKWLDKQLKQVDMPYVAGHSNGGRIALAYLQKYPDRFKHLILIDSAGLVNRSPLRVLKLKALWLTAKLGKPLKQLPLVNKVFYRFIGASDYGDARPNMRVTMQNMLAADSQINLSRVNTPTTLIWGRHDTITPLKDGRRMQRQLPNATFHVIDAAKHSPQATHPEQVANIISEVMA